MAKMNFTDPVLEKIVRRWEWTRNNTVLLFETAAKENILNYSSKTDKKVAYTFQPLLFQFQCVVTTTDTYYRKIIGAKNQNFGVFAFNEKVIAKKDLSEDFVKKILKEQIALLENALKTFSDKDGEKHIGEILKISDHEYLHQGQMIIMFREAGVDLPERFKKAWAL